VCRRRARGENNGDGSAWDDRKGSLYTSSRSSFSEVEKEGAVRSTRPSSTAMTAAFQRRRTTQPCTQRPTVPLRQHPSAVPYTAALFFCLLNVKGGTRDQGARRYSIDSRAARKRAPEFRLQGSVHPVVSPTRRGIRSTLYFNPPVFEDCGNRAPGPRGAAQPLFSVFESSKH